MERSKKKKLFFCCNVILGKEQKIYPDRIALACQMGPQRKELVAEN